ITDDHSGAKHLWIGDVERNQVRRLTETSTDESAPEVSPDGHHIGYVQTDFDTDLIEIPLDGSPLRPLLATSRREEYPSWCGSNQYVYLTNRGGTPELWLGDAVHASQRPVVSQSDFPDTTLEIEPPTCSPDGASVVYKRRARKGTAVWMSPIAGGNPVRLLDARHVRPPLAWSPDGEGLAFGGSADTGGGALFKIRVKTPQSPVVVRKGMSPFVEGWSAMSGVPPAWSPTGEWITVRTMGGFGVASADGSRVNLLVKNFKSVPAGGHAWSSDGSRIFYTSLESDRTILHSLDVASAEDRVVRDLGTNVIFTGDSYIWQRHAFSAARNSLA